MNLNLSENRPKMNFFDYRATSLWKFGIGIFAFLSLETFLYLWRTVVDPFPDYMYLEFFSIFNNYMVLSQYIGNDITTLIELSGLRDYPLGFFLIAWSVALVGLQQFFLSDPWFLSVFMTIPLVFAVQMMHWSRKKILWYLVLILLFPSTHILLKSWNVQSLIVVYTFCALLTYFSHIKDPRGYKIIIFAVFAWLSIIIKHLGAFYFTIIFLTIFLWRLLRGEKPLGELAIALVLLFSSLPFYPSESFSYLPWVIQSHNPYISGTTYLLCGALILITGIFGIIFLRRHIKEHVNLSLHSNVIWLMAGILVWKLILFTPLEEFETHLAAIIFLGLTISGSIFVVRKFNPTSYEALQLLLLINLFGYSSVLYLSLVGHTCTIFLLPMLLLLFVWIEYVHCIRQVTAAALIFLTYINFFPSQDFFTEYLGADEAYRRLFNTDQQNPLGWQKSGLTQSRRDLIKILELYEYPKWMYEKKLKIGSTNIELESFGFTADYIRYFPEVEIRNPLAEELIRTAVHAIHNWQINGRVEKLDSLFSDWIRKGIIPVMITPSTNNKDEDFVPEERLRQAVKAFMEREIEDSELEQLGDEIVKILIPYTLLKPQLMKNFQQHSLFYGDSEYVVLVHQSLNFRSKSTGGHNYYLARELGRK